MTSPRLVHHRELVVALDYGQFYLHTADNDPEFAVALVELAQDADGIAQADGLLVMESPHQNNFEMPLTVEVWDHEPADDLDEWQEAFEAHLHVSNQLVYESPTVDLTEIDVPPGSYHALITGRGFVANGWPGSTEPGDEWRVRLWPTSDAVRARRLKRWEESGSDRWNAPLAEEAAGLVAGRAIGAAVRRGASVLSGELGRVELKYVYAVPRRNLFKPLAYWEGWMGCMGGVNQLAVGGLQQTMCVDPDEDPEHAFMGGKHVEVRSTWTAFRRPEYVEMTWNWYAPPSPERIAFPDKKPVLTTDTVLRFTLKQRSDHGGAPVTDLHLAHSNLPAEWLDDMRQFWAWQLEYADKRLDLGR